ncbi:hypothetical protein V8C86DRAFT_2867680 [Haematococcus lacustris]
MRRCALLGLALFAAVQFACCPVSASLAPDPRSWAAARQHDAARLQHIATTWRQGQRRGVPVASQPASLPDIPNQPGTPPKLELPITTPKDADAFACKAVLTAAMESTVAEPPIPDSTPTAAGAPVTIASTAAGPVERAATHDVNQAPSLSVSCMPKPFGSFALWSHLAVLLVGMWLGWQVAGLAASPRSDPGHTSSKLQPAPAPPASSAAPGSSASGVANQEHAMPDKDSQQCSSSSSPIAMTVAYTAGDEAGTTTCPQSGFCQQLPEACKASQPGATNQATSDLHSSMGVPAVVLEESSLRCTLRQPSSMAQPAPQLKPAAALTFCYSQPHSYSRSHSHPFSQSQPQPWLTSLPSRSYSDSQLSSQQLASSQHRCQHAASSHPAPELLFTTAPHRLAQQQQGGQAEGDTQVSSKAGAGTRDKDRAGLGLEPRSSCSVSEPVNQSSHQPHAAGDSSTATQELGHDPCCRQSQPWHGYPLSAPPSTSMQTQHASDSTQTQPCQPASLQPAQVPPQPAEQLLLTAQPQLQPAHHQPAHQLLARSQVQPAHQPLQLLVPSQGLALVPAPDPPPAPPGLRLAMEIQCDPAALAQLVKAFGEPLARCSREVAAAVGSGVAAVQELGQRVGQGAQAVEQLGQGLQRLLYRQQLAEGQLLASACLQWGVATHCVALLAASLSSGRLASITQHCSTPHTHTTSASSSLPHALSAWLVRKAADRLLPGWLSSALPAASHAPWQQAPASQRGRGAGVGSQLLGGLARLVPWGSAAAGRASGAGAGEGQQWYADRLAGGAGPGWAQEPPHSVGTLAWTWCCFQELGMFGLGLGALVWLLPQLYHLSGRQLAASWRVDVPLGLALLGGGIGVQLVSWLGGGGPLWLLLWWTWCGLVMAMFARPTTSLLHVLFLAVAMPLAIATVPFIP